MPYRTESFGRGRIASTILANETVPFNLNVSKLPVEENQFITINPDTPSEEIFFYTTKSGVIGEAGTLTITGRGFNVNDDLKFVANQNEHEENVEFKLALNHIILNNKADLDFAHFTGELRVPIFANAAARDALITSPEDGLLAYLNDIEDFTSFKNGIWINGLGGGGSATFYQDSTDDGTLVGAVDNANTAYQMSNAPASPAAVTVVYNGIVQELGGSDDYTILGDVITFNVAPISGKILALYPDSPVGGGNAKTRIVPNTDATNGELYRSTDDANSWYYKSDTGIVTKVMDSLLNTIPKLSLGINPSVDYPASDILPGFVEKATDVEAAAGIDNSRYITSKQGGDNYGTTIVPGDTSYYASTGSLNVSQNLTWEEFDSKIINTDGTYRITVDRRMDNTIGSIGTRILKNAIVLNTTPFTTSSNIQTQSIDVSVTAGDVFSCEGKQGDDDSFGIISNFNFKGELVPTYFSVT